jgi:hypothetical protein
MGDAIVRFGARLLEPPHTLAEWLVCAGVGACSGVLGMKIARWWKERKD